MVQEIRTFSLFLRFNSWVCVCVRKTKDQTHARIHRSTHANIYTCVWCWCWCCCCHTRHAMNAVRVKMWNITKVIAQRVSVCSWYVAWPNDILKRMRNDKISINSLPNVHFSMKFRNEGETAAEPGKFLWRRAKHRKARVLKLFTLGLIPFEFRISTWWLQGIVQLPSNSSQRQFCSFSPFVGI